jgi:hypothetical protein
MKRNGTQKRIDLILNGKGGVGKSFFTVNFVQYLKDSSTSHLAIDTDNENSTLKRFHPEAHFVDLSKSTAIDALFSELNAHSLVVVDCRAASTDIFLDFFVEMEVFKALRELDAAMTIISPVNHEPDSIKQIQVITERINGNASYVVVKNHSFSDEFTIFEQSKIRTRLADELAAKEIDMPKLQDWLVVRLNQIGITITPALQHPNFAIFERQRLKNWQRKFYEQIEAAHDVLLDVKKPSQKKKESPGE